MGKKEHNEVHICIKIICSIYAIKIKRQTLHLNIHYKYFNEPKTCEFMSTYTIDNNNNTIINDYNSLFSGNNNNIYDKIIHNYKKDLIKYNNNIYPFIYIYNWSRLS